MRDFIPHLLNQELYKNEPIEIKVNYALLAYNNTIHSVTKLKPFEITSGHLNLNSPFDIELNNQLINNYIENHKGKMKILYKNINDKLNENKEKIINKLNENREKLPDLPDQVFVKNRQKQQKTKNKYKPEQLIYINKPLKKAKIKIKHGNTTENIHLSNIKRPKMTPYEFLHLPGTSA